MDIWIKPDITEDLLLEIMYTFLVRRTNKSKTKPQLLTQNHNHVGIELIMVSDRSEDLVW